MGNIIIFFFFLQLVKNPSCFFCSFFNSFQERMAAEPSGVAVPFKTFCANLADSSGKLLFSPSGSLSDSRYPLSNCVLSSTGSPAPALLPPHRSWCRQSAGPYLNDKGRGGDVLQPKFIALISRGRDERAE